MPSITHKSIVGNSSICASSSSSLVEILPKSTPADIDFCKTEEPVTDLDPGNWTAVIHNSTRVYLVRKGPFKIKEDKNFKYPNNNNNRELNSNDVLDGVEKLPNRWKCVIEARGDYIERRNVKINLNE